MLILAFETSAKSAGVALHDGQHLLGEHYLNTGLTHSQTLLVMANDLITQCSLLPQNVTHVAVAAGPGSFTGVRIGVAAAKGFAWGAEIPCFGVSALEAMALGLGVWDGYLCPVMDARRNQIYHALFRADCGKLTRICEDRAVSLTDLEKDIQKIEKPIFLVGDGSLLCYNTLSEVVPSLILPPEHRMHQRAAGVALAAAAAIARGEAGSASSLVPNYLRLSQAERERLEREQQKKKEI